MEIKQLLVGNNGADSYDSVEYGRLFNLKQTNLFDFNLENKLHSMP